MPTKKIKSPDYLSFLATKRCVVTGSKNIEIHHESLLTGFGGGFKNHNDFQALPLSKDLHIYARHDLGRDGFWSKYEINPYEQAYLLLCEYLESAPLDFDEAITYSEELNIKKDQWSYKTNSRFKKL